MTEKERFLLKFWKAEEEERKTMFIRSLLDNSCTFFKKEILNARVDSAENYFIFRFEIDFVVSLYRLFDFDECVRSVFPSAGILINPVPENSCVISVHLDKIFFE